MRNVHIPQSPVSLVVCFDLEEHEAAVIWEATAGEDRLVERTPPQGFDGVHEELQCMSAPASKGRAQTDLFDLHLVLSNSAIQVHNLANLACRCVGRFSASSLTQRRGSSLASGIVLHQIRTQYKLYFVFDGMNLLSVHDMESIGKLE